MKKLIQGATDSVTKTAVYQLIPYDDAGNELYYDVSDSSASNAFIYQTNSTDINHKYMIEPPYYNTGIYKVSSWGDYTR